MPRPFEDTSLWRTAFGARNKDRYADQRKSLELAYRQFRDSVLPLLRQVSIDLPALTVHDEKHVDQLWDVASEICGADYPLNPLEAFILGGAFLLHDAALCLAAYDSGKQGLMRTAEWRDAVSRLWKQRGVTPSENGSIALPTELEDRAIFEILRAKHAHQASLLIDRNWKHPTTGQPLLLLENVQLQEDYGKLIGDVASSHHWPIRQVEDHLAKTVPASASWPREWDVDALKVACILRCADAAAIDERRAPTRLFVIRAPADSSRRHWAFQNNLYPAKLERETLTFVSKRPFEPSMMDDWWLAFDAINIVDQELKASNGLLAAYAGPTLPARQVFGANSPGDFQKTVSVRGWTPIDASVQITDISGTIRRFGGAELYGADPEALLRELIQNGADAIRARRRRDPAFRNSSKYPGHVTIRVHATSGSPLAKVSVEDDGIGMPPEVLTGPLLDFGTSFWGTELAGQLYPGLQSDPEFKPAGKYGVGFFSAFMYSDNVRVISRPLHKGIDEFAVLAFRYGLKGRAELRAVDPIVDGTVSSNASTVVAVDIDLIALVATAVHGRFYLGDVDTTPYLNSAPDLLSAIKLFLSRLCFALDVAVYVTVGNEPPVVVNYPHYRDWPARDFLERLYATFIGDKEVPQKLIPLVQPIVSAGGVYGGRACVAIEPSSSIVRSIDGFWGSGPPSYSSTFVGVTELTPSVVSRSRGELLVDGAAWTRWGRTQLDLLNRNRVEFAARELLYASQVLASLSVDATTIAHCFVNGKCVPLENCIDMIKDNGQLLILTRPASGYIRDSDTWEIADVDHFSKSIAQGIGTLVPTATFVHDVTSNIMARSYYRFSKSDPENVDSVSVLGCLMRLLIKHNMGYLVSIKNDVLIGRYSGDSTIWMQDGDEIKARAVVITMRNAAG
jgi:hypothetical protein